MQCRQVLMIEDNPGDAILVREALKEAELSFELTHLKDGDEAIDYIEALTQPGRVQPDLVLLDLHLPKRNGWRVFAAIRSHPLVIQIPVVIFTSSSDPRDRVRGENADRTIYIRKPSTIEEFMAVGREIRRFAFDYWETA
ncbi:MAG TPA: response regulator [Bryobacteraceae bacterium]|nr:response regulator [Bryobacteraceae bacterium]